MKLSENVKAKSWYWNLIPWISNNTAQAIYPNIYLPVKVYKNLSSEKQDAKHLALLAHEQEHIKRQKILGLARWMIRYFLSSKFRFEEELIADIPRMKVLKHSGLEFDLDSRARRLSGWLYFWPVSYSVAKSRLRAAWEKLN